MRIKMRKGIGSNRNPFSAPNLKYMMTSSSNNNSGVMDLLDISQASSSKSASDVYYHPIQPDSSTIPHNTSSSNIIVFEAPVVSTSIVSSDDEELCLNDENQSLTGHQSLHSSNTSQSGVKRWSRLSLVWENLIYKVKENKIRCGSHNQTSGSWCPSIPRLEKTCKTILDQQNGRLDTGSLVAVIGPSGAGKSSLLKCLAGVRRKNISGNIYVTSNDPFHDTTDWSDDHEMNHKSPGCHSSLKNVKVVFISQDDRLIQVLTVRESLLFASRLKNFTEDDTEFHEVMVQRVMRDLGLETCADQKVEDISGGQMKRLSFALELVSRTDFMILDEPTSGLDSSSAAQTIAVLRNLTTSKSKIGIITSIHQPSAKVLFTFSHLYILSKDGQLIFNGTTDQLLSHFSSLGLNCPPYHNPADFVIEIASGDFGDQKITTLVECSHDMMLAEKDQRRYTSSSQVTSGINAVIDRMTTSKKYPVMRHLSLLMERTWISTKREPLLCWLRLAQHVVLAFMGSYMYSYKVGEANGCFQDLVDSLPANVTSLHRLSATTEESFMKQQRIASDNATFMFFAILFLAFANAMPTVLTFPLEMVTFLKERRNAWYGTGTYYFSKLFADTPFQIMIPIIFCAISWTSTGQISEFWRFFLFTLISILVASISQAIGILISIIFLNDVNSAVFMTPLSLTPFFLMGGFFVNFQGVSWIMKPIALLSYIRYSFESLIVLIYGYERCSSNSMTALQETKIMTKLSCFWASKEFGDDIPYDLSSLNMTSSSDVTTESSSNSYVSIISTLFSLMKNDISEDQTPWISSIFGLTETCVSEVIFKLKEFTGTGSSPAGPSEDDLKLVEDAKRWSTGSYMLTHWDLEDRILWINIPILFSLLISLRIFTYFLLIQRTDRKLRNM